MKLHEVTLVGRDGKPLINPAVIEHERERLSPPRSAELGGLSGRPVLG
jgi:hypothetical protein